MAYHFGLQNPNSLSQSVIETLFPISLCGSGTTSVPYTPYDPSQSAEWYANNFNYPTGSDAVTAPLSLRPLLVTHNPVSNYVQQVYNNNDGQVHNGVTYPSSYQQTIPATQPSISDPILPNYMLPYSGANNQHFKGEWDPNALANTYGTNDIVIAPNEKMYPNYSGPRYTFICVVPTTVGGAVGYAPAGAALVPWAVPRPITPMF